MGILGGWDISKANLADAMARGKVLDYDLQRQLRPLMEGMAPLPGIFDQNFVAANQAERADNVIEGSKADQLAKLRKDLVDFKANKMWILWWCSGQQTRSAMQNFRKVSTIQLRTL